jgi:secreted trypsin-like serine protease
MPRRFRYVFFPVRGGREPAITHNSHSKIGGPLILEGDYPDEDLQVGIVSWGVNCARSDYPGE